MVNFHYELSVKSYSKLIGHCIKYSHCVINGILIGTVSKKEQCVHIQDIIPLFHSNHYVTPLLEVALSQIEQYAANKGLSIVGYYHGNELSHDTDISDIASIIGKKIVSNVDMGCLIMVCNDSIINEDKDTLSLKLHTYNESTSQWKEHKSISLVQHATSTLNDIKRSVIAKKLYNKIIDFDNHFDTISADWTNPDFNKAIETL